MTDPSFPAARPLWRRLATALALATLTADLYLQASQSGLRDVIGAVGLRRAAAIAVLAYAAAFWVQLAAHLVAARTHPESGGMQNLGSDCRAATDSGRLSWAADARRAPAGRR